METGVLIANTTMKNLNVGVFVMAEYINGNCIKCGCYWGASDAVRKAVGCECECHND